MLTDRIGREFVSVRSATLEDIERLEKRSPQEHDRMSVQARAALIAFYADGREVLTYVSRVHADGGVEEIRQAQLKGDQK